MMHSIGENVVQQAPGFVALLLPAHASRKWNDAFATGIAQRM
jgi:hypothetical protein